MHCLLRIDVDLAKRWSGGMDVVQRWHLLYVEEFTSTSIVLPEQSLDETLPKKSFASFPNHLQVDLMRMSEATFLLGRPCSHALADGSVYLPVCMVAGDMAKEPYKSAGFEVGTAKV